MNATCANCRFWDVDNADPITDSPEQLNAACRRFPPVYVSGDINETEGFQQPYTWEGRWCGEWKPRLEPVA